MAGISSDVKARSGQGSPATAGSVRATQPTPSEAFSRWEKASVHEKPRQGRKLNYFQALPEATTILRISCVTLCVSNSSSESGTFRDQFLSLIVPGVLIRY